MFENEKNNYITITGMPVLTLRADEGMWLLSRLKQHNEAQMKKLGLKIPWNIL